MVVGCGWGDGVSERDGEEGMGEGKEAMRGWKRRGVRGGGGGDE